MIDLASSSLALGLVLALASPPAKLDLLLAPILLLALNGVLGLYGSKGARGTARAGDGGTGELAVRLLVGVCFAWFASLLIPIGTGAQIGLWGSFVLLDTAAGRSGAKLTRRSCRTERWILVGDESVAQRLKDYRPLREHATIVCAVPLLAAAR